MVTVHIDDRWMPEEPDGPEPRRVGALVLRVWQEGTRDDPRLRIRLIGREDVTRDVAETALASTIDDALAYARAWLERFSDVPCRKSAR